MNQLRHRWNRILALLLGLVMLGHGAVQAAPDPYRLRSGDRINVTLLGHPELSLQDQILRPDGRVSFALVSDVRLEGMTVSEASMALSEVYRSYLTSPQVLVTVARFRPVRVTVLGKVGRPGTLEFEESPTLIQALATAGGLHDRANRQAIKVVSPDGATEIYDLNRLLQHPDGIPHLAEGSMVEVDEVWGPDLYQLVPVIASLITAGAVLIRGW